MMESILQLVGALATLAVIVGAFGLGTEWMRQRGRMSEKAIEMEAWREAQARVEEAHNRVAEASLALQRDAQQEAVAQREAHARAIVIQESLVALAKAQLQETKNNSALLQEMIEAMRAGTKRE